MFFDRKAAHEIVNAIAHFPVTVVTGPRQCGKSTLVKHLISEGAISATYLDLERPSDLQKLENAEWFLTSQKNKLICIDEVQRKPELFPLIRSLVDEWNRPGCFVLLGSASRDLLKQTSETLAGRIVYKPLTPFLLSELQAGFSLESYISRGAFPRSILAKTDAVSLEWRKSFIATFLERDLLQWLNFTPATMQRLWQMLAHVNGQTVNYSSLGNALGVSNQTVKNYIDLLKSTFMLEVVEPYVFNTTKRLVKAPKVYVADSGIAAALLNIHSFDELAGHPSLGAVWEQMVLTNIKGEFPEAECFFYRTSGGAEIDFVVKLHRKVIAVECKASYSPTLTKGNFQSIADISPAHTFVVTPSAENWSVLQGVEVVSLEMLLNKLNKMSRE